MASAAVTRGSGTKIIERRTRVRKVGLEEAINYVLAPTSDSELSDLDDSDDSDYEESNPDVEKEDNDSDESKEIEILQDDEVEFTTEISAEPQNSKEFNHIFRWKKLTPPVPQSSFPIDQFSPPPEDPMTPYEYFKLFWDDSILKMLADETNRYSVEKSGVSVNTSANEIEQFIGIQMQMSIVKMPRYEMYWSSECYYEPVASVMGIGRYKKLRQYIHVIDNVLKENEQYKGDKLFKVRPLLDALRKNFLTIEQEHCQSIDEQIIPAKTKRSSGVRQYNPKKIHKWGFKNLVRAGQSGFMYDFFLYGGKNSAGADHCGAEETVFRLVEEMPKNSGFRLFFDNYFSTLNVLLQLKKIGIHCTGTFRSNRLGKCPLISDKELKSAGRGSHDYQCDQNSGIHLVKWADNKCVVLGSTFSGVESTGTVRRWNGKAKAYQQVPQPDIVRDYNQAMGGVDLADMLISLYRTKIICLKRWYIKIIFHCVDMAKVNAWILYRRHCKQRGEGNLALLPFITQIAAALRLSGKANTERRESGRPKKRSLSPPRRVRRPPQEQRPVADVRYDGFQHWPTFRAQRNRCKFCTSGFSQVYCDKCKICLCLNKNRNCFRDFHV